MLYTFNSLISVAVQLRETFASCSNDKIKCVVLSYSKENDNLHLHYFTDINLITPFRKEDIVLACYYAPKGNWLKWYGNEWRWDLSVERIALDIYTNTFMCNNFFPLVDLDVLPSWLRDAIELYI